MTSPVADRPAVKWTVSADGREPLSLNAVTYPARDGATADTSRTTAATPETGTPARPVTGNVMVAWAGIRAEPRLSRLVRHPRGIPQYTVGHAARVAAATAAEQAWPGLFLTGNALRGVGYNDCVREAYAVADRVERHVARQ